MRKATIVVALALLCVAAGGKGIEWDDPRHCWRVEGDTLSSSGGKIFAKVGPIKDMMASGKLRVDQFQEGGTTRGCILLRYREQGDVIEYYLVSFRRTSITLQRITVAPEGNKWPLLASEKLPTPVGKWIHFKVAVTGNRIQVALRCGRTISMDALDGNPIPEGRFGFGAERVAMTVKCTKLVVRE